MSSATLANPDSSTLEARRERVLELSDEIYDPCAMGAGMQIGMREMGLIRSLEVAPAGHRSTDGWRVEVEIRFTGPECLNFFYFKQQLEERLEQESWVTRYEVTFCEVFDWTEDEMTRRARDMMALRKESLRALAAEAERVAAGQPG